MFQNGNHLSKEIFAAAVGIPGLEFFPERPFDVVLGRTLCMLKKLLLVALLLAAVAAVAAPTDSSPQSTTSAPAIKSYLMPDLSFKSVFSLDLLQPSETLAAQPDTVAAPRPRRGFCRCSCGFQCTSSADCGGASCDPFITCCVRKTQNSEVEWFTRSFESSSHKTPTPDAILKAVLKAECK